MIRVFVTSSLVIGAVFLVRAVFHKSLSYRWQYALWLAAALYLLFPYQVSLAILPAEPIPNQQSVTVSSEKADYPSQHPVSKEVLETVMPTEPVTQAKLPTGKVQMKHPLRLIWMIGAVTMAMVFLSKNLQFSFMLRKRRRPLDVSGCPIPVYVVEEGLRSPCLFGLFRPSVYLTVEAMEEKNFPYVLAHEQTHARHLDPLWALLRCVLLTIYWFHPLVWAAALASEQDCELACDEGALARLGRDASVPYGQTLLSMIAVRSWGSSPMLTATTMTAGKRQLKKRVKAIAKGQKQKPVITVLALLLVLAVTACAAVKPERKESEIQQPEPMPEEETVPAPEREEMPLPEWVSSMTPEFVPDSACSVGMRSGRLAVIRKDTPLLYGVVRTTNSDGQEGWLRGLGNIPLSRGELVLVIEEYAARDTCWVYCPALGEAPFPMGFVNSRVVSMEPEDLAESFYAVLPEGTSLYDAPNGTKREMAATEELVTMGEEQDGWVLVERIAGAESGWIRQEELRHDFAEYPRFTEKFPVPQWDLTEQEATKILQTALIEAYENTYGEFEPMKPETDEDWGDAAFLRSKIPTLEVAEMTELFYQYDVIFPFWVDRFTGSVYCHYNGLEPLTWLFDPLSPGALGFAG